MLGRPRCLGFGGSRVEAAIAREVLLVVEPMAIEAALEAERRRMESRDERQRIADLELQQARYEASLAERRYAACDPDNRLIAAQLEKSWSFEIRVRELMAGQATLTTIMEGLLNARATLVAEVAKLHKRLLEIARADGVCRRLMTVPGVGALTALTFKTAIDDPTRIAKSRDVGPLFGLTPGRYQSGETDIIGKITKVGDVMVRTALFEAATVMLTRSTKSSRLKAWALDLVKRRGTKRAIVALARKLGVVLHRIWVDGSTFRCAEESAAMPALITAK
jgi:transposase